MDLHALALRASKNEILAHYFGRKGNMSEWENVFGHWPEEEVQTFELILNEIESMSLGVVNKAGKRHEINETRLKQRFEALKANLLKQASQ